MVWVVIGVPGLLGGAGGGAQRLLFVLADVVGAGGALDDAGPDLPGADPLGDLGDVDILDLVDGLAHEVLREAAKRALVGVEAGGADDVDAGGA